LDWVTVYGRVNQLGDVTAPEVDSAFYPPWDGKVNGKAFGLKYNQ